MDRLSRTEMLMEFAVAAAKRSTCLRTQVGAILAVDGRPLSIGYNGAPPGLPHCTPETCNPTQPCFRTIHAEQNAIAWAARNGVRLIGSVLYATHSPCRDCAKLIIAAGIIEVHYLDEYRDPEPMTLLRRAKINVAKHSHA